MGKHFKKLRKSVMKEALLVRTALRSAVALYLYKNEDDADDIKRALEPILRALKNEEYDTEDMIHKALENALMKILEKKPIYVRAAFSDLLHIIVSMIEEKIGGFDEDIYLSHEEKKAYISIIEGIIEVCEMAINQ